MGYTDSLFLSLSAGGPVAAPSALKAGRDAPYKTLPRLKAAILDELRCPICLGVAQDPVVCATPNCQPHCRACVRGISPDKRDQCTTCRAMGAFRPSAGHKHLIGELAVICPCDWRGKLRDLNSHACGYACVKCGKLLVDPLPDEPSPLLVADAFRSHVCRSLLALDDFRPLANMQKGLERELLILMHKPLASFMDMSMLASPALREAFMCIGVGHVLTYFFDCGFDWRNGCGFASVDMLDGAKMDFMFFDIPFAFLSHIAAAWDGITQDMKGLLKIGLLPVLKHASLLRLALLGFIRVIPTKLFWHGRHVHKENREIQPDLVDKRLLGKLTHHTYLPRVRELSFDLNALSEFSDFFCIDQRNGLLLHTFVLKYLAIFPNTPRFLHPTRDQLERLATLSVSDNELPWAGVVNRSFHFHGALDDRLSPIMFVINDLKRLHVAMSDGEKINKEMTEYNKEKVRISP